MFARIGAYWLGEFDRRVRAPVLAELDRDHVADVDAADAHVGLFGERERAREGDREAVALRLQRQRPAEGLPQEQQQPEAAEREQDDHEDVAERGSALLHLSPSLRCSCVLGGRRTGVDASAAERSPCGRERVPCAALAAAVTVGLLRIPASACAFLLGRRLQQADEQVDRWVDFARRR